MRAPSRARETSQLGRPAHITLSLTPYGRGGRQQRMPWSCLAQQGGWRSAYTQQVPPVACDYSGSCKPHAPAALDAYQGILFRICLSPTPSQPLCRRNRHAFRHFPLIPPYAALSNRGIHGARPFSCCNRIKFPGTRLPAMA